MSGLPEKDGGFSSYFEVFKITRFIGFCAIGSNDVTGHGADNLITRSLPKTSGF